MPVQKTYDTLYWTTCWAWIIPYPCRKVKKVTRWCYMFERITVHYFVLIAKCEGWENGIKYTWTEPAFNLIGTYHYPGEERCFEKELSRA